MRAEGDCDGDRTRSGGSPNLLSTIMRFQLRALVGRQWLNAPSSSRDPRHSDKWGANRCTTGELMRCSKCGSDNPTGKKFCGDCGAPLENRCAKWGSSSIRAKLYCSVLYAMFSRQVFRFAI